MTSEIDRRKQFWAKVDRTETCWLWTAYTTPNGYGVFENKSPAGRLAHRISFEMARGTIPTGLEIDHLCRVRNCVRPDHLEAVTRKTNVHRTPYIMKGMAKTHCPQGHAYTPDNLRTGKWRGCATCHRDKMRERYRAARGLPL